MPEEIESKGKSVKWNGKKLGYFLEEKNDGIGFTSFITHRKHSKHFFRSFSGWSMNEGLIKDLCMRFVDRIVLQDDEEKKLYITSPFVWKEFGIIYEHRDFERQLVLPIKFFRVV